MDKFSLTALAGDHLDQAHDSHAGRSTETLVGGSRRRLRQTLITLTDGTHMSEHDFPGEATLHVLSGRIRLEAGADGGEAAEGDLVVIPPERHSVTALTDTVFLLTVVK
ncbi:hypothetical protein LX16_1672 [Stackebrandtia albiflava]|uniref:Quercetin dioxygenase-like cupin family protein n=1 Tax=Stackebrandtia albiflava TaxID=406432 RepID=A0A562VDL3_9ACTN|nr:LuxR family transcriptional regulator [Stackebrandtia albiflava]TWJ15952.1 hypothetical protein LX16_1672 [Stackebrandtia albiflava]